MLLLRNFGALQSVAVWLALESDRGSRYIWKYGSNDIASKGLLLSNARINLSYASEYRVNVSSA